MKKELNRSLADTQTYVTTLDMRAQQLAADIFSTPAMLGLMELTCVRLVEPYLDENEQTVGIHVDAHGSHEHRAKRDGNGGASRGKRQQAALQRIGCERSGCQDRRGNPPPRLDQYQAIWRRRISRPAEVLRFG